MKKGRRVVSKVDGKNGWTKEICPWSKTNWAWAKDGKCTCKSCKPPKKKED